jgi:hypothetical protein
VSAGRPFEEKRDRYVEDLSGALEPAGAHPILALFVLLHLLKGCAERLALSFSWLIPSIMRRMRSRLPTCLSMGLGSLVLAIDYSFDLTSGPPLLPRSMNLMPASSSTLRIAAMLLGIGYEAKLQTV